MNSQDTTILAIRHGETAWNKATRIQGQLDIDLNDTGRQQAQAVGAALADEPISMVYSSDLCRAANTAQPLANARGLVVVPCEGLRERHFGEWQGQTYGDIEKNHPKAFARWRDREPAFAVTGAESLLVFMARIRATVRELASRHPGKTIALFSHGGCMDMMYRLATGVDLQAQRTWPISNAVVNRLRFDGETLHLLAWGEAGHLDALEA
jgi:2,3-bisphosphoglycerate-dependent phosphoglycerate mutase